MKTLIFSILFLAAIAVSGTNNEPKVITTTAPVRIDLNAGMGTLNAYDIAFIMLESGEPITFDVSKLTMDDPTICCMPPGTCGFYCCYKC